MLVLICTERLLAYDVVFNDRRLDRFDDRRLGRVETNAMRIQVCNARSSSHYFASSADLASSLEVPNPTLTGEMKLLTSSCACVVY